MTVGFLTHINDILLPQPHRVPRRQITSAVLKLLGLIPLYAIKNY